MAQSSSRSALAFGETKSVFANVHPLGFLAAARAQEAERFIGQTEQIVSALGPTEADLKPVVEALAAAKSLYAAQDYAKAVARAKRAAALAANLNDRFNAYLAEWKTLQACREELESLGFPTEILDAALDAADKEVVRPVPEEGTVVPNYVGARAMLERAVEKAQTLVGCARDASREIFLATLAVEALSDAPSTQAPNWLAVRLEGMIEQATRELALGHAPEASRIASEARVRADDALAGATRAWELLDMAAAILDGLGAKGSVADALAEKVESVRGAFSRGFLDHTTASEVAGRLSDDVAALAKEYPRAREVLDGAERVYALLRREGFCSYEVDDALSGAERSLGAGDWAGVRDKVGIASHTFVRLRQERESLTRAIAEIDERVTLLKGFRLPLIKDVEDILGRAKEEVRSGRISGANEDLLLASALMLQATRTGSEAPAPAAGDGRSSGPARNPQSSMAA